jgi:Spy/CpxP family protein refolding chaperone
VTAEDAVPPKPPGGTEAPKPAGDKPAGQVERRPGAPGDRLKMMTEKLNLTQEQQDKIKAIQDKSGPELRELLAKGRDSLSETERTRVRELMKTQFEEMAAVLTPEQKEKMKELRGSGPRGERKPGEGRGKPGEAK